MKLLNLLQKEEYTYTPEQMTVHSNFEGLNDYGGISTLFDDLCTELKRIPTQTEYIESGSRRAATFFQNQSHHYVPRYKCSIKFYYDEHLKHAIRYRLSRTYPSYIIEQQVKEYLENYEDVEITCSKHLDLNFGVDLVIRYKQTQLYYLHIVANSHSAKRLIENKGTRKSYIPHNGTKHYWTRNWGPAHTLLSFNTKLTDRMQEINGNLLFNEHYLDIYFNNLFSTGMYELDNEQSEIHEFYTFLTGIYQPQL